MKLTCFEQLSKISEPRKARRHVWTPYAKGARGAFALAASAALLAFAMPVGAQETSATPSSNSLNIPYVMASEALPAYLRTAFFQIGARVAGPGAERVTGTGTITYGATPAVAIPIRLVYQIPGKLRVDENGNNTTTYAFNGTASWGTGATGQPSATQSIVIESVLGDFIDQLFYMSQNRMAVRFLGPQYSINDTASPYAGSRYDIFTSNESLNEIAVRTGDTAAQRFFMINCATRLLDFVWYETSRQGQKVQVQTRFSNWTSANKLYFPANITRIENGSVVFTLSLASISFSPAVADATFTSASN